MPKGVIILRRKDKELPEPYLDKVLEHNKSAVAAAFVDRGELLISSVANTTVDKIKKTASETDREFKDYPILFAFFNHTNALLTEDKQPYVLLRNDKNEPIVSAFLEGDFSNMEQADSSHSDEYEAVKELLIPKFEKMFKEAGSKLDQFMGMLQDKLVKREMQTLFNKGSITIIACTGEIVTFAKGNENKEFPWGWTTNSYGYEQPTKEELAKEEPKSAAQSKLDKIKAALAEMEDDDEDEDTEEDEAKEGAVAADVAAKSEAAPRTQKKPLVSDSDYEVVMLSPPAGESNNRLKKWYRKNYGSVPNNWSDRPAVPIRRLRAKGEQPKPVIQVASKAETSIPIEATKPKDTSIQHIPPAAADAKSEQVTDETLPVIPPREKKWVNDTFLAEAIDDNSKEIVDPKEYQAFEEKYPTFAQAFNLDSLHKTFGISFENLLRLVKEAPVAAAVLLFNYRTGYMQYQADKARQKPSEPAEGLDLRRKKM